MHQLICVCKSGNLYSYTGQTIGQVGGFKCERSHAYKGRDNLGPSLHSNDDDDDVDQDRPSVAKPCVSLVDPV